MSRSTYISAVVLYLSRWIAGLLAFIALPGTALAAQPIAGNWVTEDGKAIVTIAKCGNTYCGRIAKLLVPPPKGHSRDANNPDPALRTRPILGLQVLTGFTDAGDDWRGRVYSPEEGKSYRSILSRNANGSLKVKGCIAIFCKTQTWKRAG